MRRKRRGTYACLLAGSVGKIHFRFQCYKKVQAFVTTCSMLAFSTQRVWVYVCARQHFGAFTKQRHKYAWQCVRAPCMCALVYAHSCMCVHCTNATTKTLLHVKWNEIKTRGEWLKRTTQKKTHGISTRYLNDEKWFWSVNNTTLHSWLVLLVWMLELDQKCTKIQIA